MKKSTPINVHHAMWWLVKKSYWIFAVVTCLFIIIKSTDYFYPDFSKGFLIGKEGVFSFYKIFLYTHIISSPVALLLGIFQFSFQKSKLHKVAGKVYVGSILFLASPSGLVMAWFAIGGISSVINFSLMAILWFLFTLKAFQFIQLGNIDAHRKFMIRSFILTNSAILIRLLSFVNNHYKILDTTSGYVVISWLSWLPALLIFESIERIGSSKIG